MTTANGFAVGQVEPLDAQHLIDVEHRPHPRRRRHEGELEDPPLGPVTAALELRLDRAEVVQLLAHRLGGDEPAEALAGGDEALLAHHLERPTHRDPAGAELLRQLGLTRQQRTGTGLRRPAAATRRRSPGSGSASCTAPLASTSSMRLPNGSEMWQRSTPGMSSDHVASSRRRLDELAEAAHERGPGAPCEPGGSRLRRRGGHEPHRLRTSSRLAPPSAGGFGTSARPSTRT